VKVKRIAYYKRVHIRSPSPGASAVDDIRVRVEEKHYSHLTDETTLVAGVQTTNDPVSSIYALRAKSLIGISFIFCSVGFAGTGVSGSCRPGGETRQRSGDQNRPHLKYLLSTSSLNRLLLTASYAGCAWNKASSRMTARPNSWPSGWNGRKQHERSHHGIALFNRIAGK